MKPLFHKPRVSKLRLGIMASTMVTTMSLGYADLTYAQDDEADSLEEVVVTGSRIRRQDFTANSPIVTIDENTFENTSTVGLDTILNQLPQFIPGMTGAAAGFGGGATANGPNSQQQTGTGGSQFSAGGIGPNAFQTPGTSQVNLRGLGANRNLVLLDGRRGMPVDASMTVDLNSIPASALERVEVVSGGASAVYGADAIAGAVNFILKDNYEGMEIRTNYGITELGDAEEYRISGLFGANTADGRGNVMVGMEHSHRGEGDFWERDWYEELRRAPTVGGTDFFASDTYLTNVLNGASVWDWSIPALQTATAPVQQQYLDSVFNQLAPGTIPGGANFYVNKDGTLYTGMSGNNRPGGYRYNGPLDIDGMPFRKIDPMGGIVQNQLENWVSVPLDRYSIFARGKYEITDSVSGFANITFARSRTATQSQWSPAVAGWNALIPHGNGIYLDSLQDPATAVTGYDPVTGAPIIDPNAPTNPGFLSGGPMGLNCPATGGCTNSQAFPVPPEVAGLLATRADPNAPFEMNRVMDYMGVRGSRNTTMNYQIQAGLEGELNNGMYWDVAVSYGESENQTKVINYANLERYRAVVQSANYGRLFEAVGNQQGGNFSAATGRCTTGLPIFEEFDVSSDCIEAIATTLSQNGVMEQSTFDANIGGDLFELPAGPVQFAAGVTYRNNDYSFTTSDDLNGSNFAFSVIGLQPVNPTFGQIKVREVYGELLVPVIADGPMGMRSLNLELGGRYSDYYDTAGGVETYKALGDWLITDWMRFRGGWQRATRAPNIRELFLGRTQDVFATSGQFGDVCSQNNFQSVLSAATGVSSTGVAALATPEQAAHTLDLCQQMMTSTATDQYYGQPIDDMPGTGAMGGVYVTGNPTVKPETADTLTAGLVITSPFDSAWTQGLTVSVDWFQIELEDMIAQDLPGTIVDRCFNIERNPTGDVNNRWCQLITRDPANGSANTIDIAYSNDTGAQVSGVDVNINWNAQFADLGLDFIPGGMGVNMLATFPLELKTQAEPGAEFLDWVGHQSGPGCPTGVSCNSYDYQVFTTFNWFNGPWNASLRWQYYPDIDSGALVTEPDSLFRGVFSSYSVFALTGSYRLNDNVSLSAGIENLFDKTPPLAGGDPNATPFPNPPVYSAGGIYDPLGRRFFVSANLSF